LSRKKAFLNIEHPTLNVELKARFDFARLKSVGVVETRHTVGPPRRKAPLNQMREHCDRPKSTPKGNLKQ
jgi:hypothetical protein